jgi:tRNA threonylcarbamoyladenosine biosynthesis protein TsaE
MDQKAVIHQVFPDINAFEKGMTIGLVGCLGAGKTAFVKAVFNRWFTEIADQVQSPTYALCHEYWTGRGAVHHYDLYRLESEETLYDIGLWESMEQSGTTVFVEWVDRFPSIMKCCDIIIKINLDNDHLKRIYQLEHQGDLNSNVPFV